MAGSTLGRMGGDEFVVVLGGLRQTEGAAKVAERISAPDAMNNLQLLERTQRLLFSNVQEALALEVGLLKLKF